MKSNVVRFPVEKVMSPRLIEEKIGNMRTYRFPVARSEEEGVEYIYEWMSRKCVLIGWEPIKTGLVKAFRAGRVRHIISMVYPDSTRRGKRPFVKIACHTSKFSLFNWIGVESKVRKNPAVLLAKEQAQYFPLCKKCEAQAMEMTGFDE